MDPAKPKHALTVFPEIAEQLWTQSTHFYIKPYAQGIS